MDLDREGGVDLFVQPSDMALINVVALAESSALDLNPKYQRRDRWDRARQSQLIESFLVNVPVPPVYLSEEARGIYAVIDGKQRLTAIANYFHDEYALVGLGLRPDLEGLRFSDLPEAAAGALRMRPLRAVIILRQTAEWVKHEVFLRLNKGGQALNNQEIRNVAFSGPLNDLMIDLGEDPFLLKQLKVHTANSSAYADMTNVEMVLRFFMLANGWSDFEGDMARALDDFMVEHRYVDPGEEARLSERFFRAIRGCEAMWGDRAFKRFDGHQWRDQFIGGVYDAQMVAVDRMRDPDLAALGENPTRAVSTMTQLFRDTTFDSSVRLSTNTPSRVQYRIGRLIDALHSQR